MSEDHRRLLRKFMRRVGLLVVAVTLLFVGYVVLVFFLQAFFFPEAPRSISDKTFHYAFDPWMVQSESLTLKILTPVPDNRDMHDIPGTEGIVTDANAFVRVAQEVVYREKPSAYSLDHVSFSAPCALSPQGVSGAFIDFFAEEVGPSIWPYGSATIYISVQRGFLSFRSIFLEARDPLVQNRVLAVYPPPVAYLDAVQIASAHGGQEAMQQIGATCHLDASFSGDTWWIVWFAQDPYRSDPLLVQEIDANSGEVRKIEWREETK